MKRPYDFSGWATKNDVVCEDNTILNKDTFSSNDGKKVPLIYQHDHKNITSVVGHGILENRDEGVYCYGYLNNTVQGNHAREALKNGDIDSLSIWANNLDVAKNGEILHGNIREVSLVLAGANPGTYIESVISHSAFSPEDGENEAVVYSGEPLDEILHYSEDDDEEDEEYYDEDEDDDEEEYYDEEDDEIYHSTEDDDEEDIDPSEVFNSMTNIQKAAVGAFIDSMLKEKEEGGEVKHNVFDSEYEGNDRILSHDAMKQIFSDAQRIGSLKNAVEENLDEGEFIAHATDTTGMTVGTGDWRSTIPTGRPTTYAFNDPSMLFPDYKAMSTTPEWIMRNMDWVNIVLNGVHRTPFSRIKSVYADITADAARAKGYLKAHQKEEEIFTLLKRTTDPQTIYKKQRMDRDDVIDITDFDVVAWIRAEMRMMLNEEIARAILIGDGRLSSADDKIQETHVRPIVTDVPLYNIKYEITQAAADTVDIVAKRIINGAIRARKQYKGSGNPVMFTTEDWLTEMLLLEDSIGHKLYKTETELATALRVSRIVTVEVMENQTVPVTESGTTTNYPLIGVIVNLSDYNVGADKGGAINMFDDFDIDYNQYKYLIETRISGALVKPYSAITLYKKTTT